MIAELTAPVLRFVRSSRAPTTRLAAFRPSCRSLHGEQACHPHEVVRGSDHVGPMPSPLDSAIPRSSQTADRLAPAEDLLDPLPDSLAHPVAPVADRPTVDARPTVARVLRHVWRHAFASDALDEGCDVVALVRSQRSSAVAVIPQPPQESESLVPLGCPARVGNREADAEAVAVLHQDVPREIQLGFLPLALARQPSLGVGRRRVSVVASVLAPEVHARIARIAVRRLSALPLAVLRPEALERGPSLDQRPIDR